MTEGQKRPLLEITDLHTWFRTPHGLLQAVAGVTLRVGEGQALGIVGESGSGKTQTFYSVFGLSHGWPGVVRGDARFGDTDLLGGLDEHTRWQADADGTQVPVEKHVQRWNAIHHRRLEPVLGRQVAMIFQDARRSLVPYWTIRQHLDASLEGANGGVADSTAAGELLARFGFRDTKHVLSAYPEQLSGGEAQRAMLAFAMAASPRLLVADEPTTALDALSQLRVLRELERIHDESDVAVVLISHDLAVVRRVVSDVVVMFGGVVMEQVPAAAFDGAGQLLLHPYSADLHESQRRRMSGLPIVAQVERGGARRRARGCQYAGRCSRRPTLGSEMQARCDGEQPPQVQVGPHHFVSCWAVAS